MRFGVIGAGVIAEYHLEAIRQTQGAEAAGVFDLFPEARDAFASKHSIDAFETIEALVENGRCDVVTIGTPSGWHLEPSVAAMRAGAHVLCEKPLEVTVDRIDEMIAVAGETGRKLGGILQVRTFPGCRKAKETIDRGDLGKILIADAYIKYYRTQPYYESAGWRGTWELDGGGAAMNQGIHWIDLLLWLAGPPKTVYAACRTVGHEIEVEDVCHAIVEWRDGGQGSVEATTCAKPGFPTRIEVHGEKGSLLLEDTAIQHLSFDGGEEVQEEEAGGSGGHDDPKVFSAAGHVIHIRDMMEAIREDREPLIPGVEARQSVRFITSMYESSRLGKKVKF